MKEKLQISLRVTSWQTAGDSVLANPTVGSASVDVLLMHVTLKHATTNVKGIMS